MNCTTRVLAELQRERALSRILLIDDDPQVNEVVKAALDMLGHHVVTVEDAAEVERVIAEFDPDVALVDYLLPGRNGLDILRDISARRADSVRFLATGMADYSLLKQAVEAGASSMLCKPYHVADLVELVEFAMLLKAAVSWENAPPETAGSLLLECRASPRVNPADLAQVVAFARRSGCSGDVALRRLPVIACELMENAGAHGTSPDSNGSYRVELSDRGAHLVLAVTGGGGPFDWNKALARARTCMDRSRAAGLQLVTVLADDFRFEQEGCVARAMIGKRRGHVGPKSE